MPRHLLVAFFCLWFTAPAAFTPIQWASPRGEVLKLMPKSFSGHLRRSYALPQILTIGETSNRMVPQFTANSDNTISVGDWCVEADGKTAGDAVFVNNCNGGPTQHWNWSEGHGRSMIQLKGTNLCLNVKEKAGSLIGAAVQLQTCESEPSASWLYEAPGSIPMEDASSRSDIRHAAIVFASMTLFGVLGLSAWLWRWRAKTFATPVSQCSMNLPAIQCRVSLSAGPICASAARSGDVSMTGVSAAAIIEAHARIAAHVHRTRVFTCEALNTRASAAAGSSKQLFLKAEHEQRVGAFKIRGAVNSISLSKADYVVTQSSGNHAQAVALGCKLLSKNAIVVMPSNSPLVKVNAVRESYGGEVRFCEPTQEAREAMSAEVVAQLREEHGQEKAEEIHPNQDIRVINGQGTVALEFLEQQSDLDAIVASIGGGGLIAGIATYAKHVNPAIKIIGAEAAAAKSAYLSKKAGKLIKNPPNTQIVSIADSIKSSLGPISYPIVDALVDDVFIVSEQDIEEATKFVLERSKQVIEPGCGVAVAVATSKEFHERYPDLKKIGVVMCGGNLDLDNLPWVASKKRELET